MQDTGSGSAAADSADTRKTGSRTGSRSACCGRKTPCLYPHSLCRTAFTTALGRQKWRSARPLRYGSGARRLGNIHSSPETFHNAFLRQAWRKRGPRQPDGAIQSRQSRRALHTGSPRRRAERRNSTVKIP